MFLKLKSISILSGSGVASPAFLRCSCGRAELPAARSEKSRLRIGHIGARTGSFLSGRLPALHKKFQRVTISLLEFNAEEQLVALMKAEFRSVFKPARRREGISGEHKELHRRCQARAS